MSPVLLLRQAMGLKRTAENAIRAGRGSSQAESIVRRATESLAETAGQVDGNNAPCLVADITPQITWTEVHSIAITICQFANNLIDAEPTQ